MHTIANATELLDILRSRFEINLLHVENIEDRLHTLISMPEEMVSRES